MVLTADKGVAMAVLNKEDHTKKAEDLLSKQTYKKISEDSTSKQKTKLINLLKHQSRRGYNMMKHTKECTIQEQDLQSSMGCQNTQAWNTPEAHSIKQRYSHL